MHLRGFWKRWVLGSVTVFRLSGLNNNNSLPNAIHISIFHILSLSSASSSAAILAFSSSLRRGGLLLKMKLLKISTESW